MREWSNPLNPFNSHKALAHGKRFTAILNEDYYPPVVINLDVTGQCQYNCVWCHHRRKQVHGELLPDLSEHLASTFPYFASHWKRDGFGVEGCCIVGSQGDALLYPGLAKLMKDLHFNHIDIGLVSNGYGYDDRLISAAAHYCKFIGFSVDAGTENTYRKVHRCPADGWSKMKHNIERLCNKINKEGLRNDVGFKFLIFPENQTEVYEACKLAKELGVRYVQIRPADLPDEARMQIRASEVDTLIQKSIDDLEEPGVFEIAGIRHKFSPDLKKVLPKYCYMTALTVTITSDGKAWPCVDRRCDTPTMLADCGKHGWSALKDVWGSTKHIDLIHNVINRGGKGPACNIRCSNYGYDILFREVFSDKDNMDISLI